MLGSNFAFVICEKSERRTPDFNDSLHWNFSRASSRDMTRDSGIWLGEFVELPCEDCWQKDISHWRSGGLDLIQFCWIELAQFFSFGELSPVLHIQIQSLDGVN